MISNTKLNINVIYIVTLCSDDVVYMYTRWQSYEGHVESQVDSVQLLQTIDIIAGVVSLNPQMRM
jgi:hypothetical protein